MIKLRKKILLHKMSLTTISNLDVLTEKLTKMVSIKPRGNKQEELIQGRQGQVKVIRIQTRIKFIHLELPKLNLMKDFKGSTPIMGVSSTHRILAVMLMKFLLD